MARRRRQVIAGAGAALAAGLAGCTGGPLTAEATPAAVTPAARRETGYGTYRTAELLFERAIGPGPLQRDVEARSAVHEYDRTVELPGVGRARAAVFAVLSTPQVTVLGRGFNPVGDMATNELAEAIQEHYADIRQLTRDGELAATVLGAEVAVSRYRGWARLLAADAPVEVYLYLAEPVESEGDFVVPLGVHARAFGPREETVRQLFAGVVHPPETES